MSELTWLYVDMNSFFASVEQELDPKLRGKPVAVIPTKADTTCCIAASYEAKAFGIKTGTIVSDAKRLCQEIILIEGDHSNYIRFHHRIIEAVESCAPVEAICSIDEIACRLGGSQRETENAKKLALKIKKTIREKVGSSLRCSIGISTNRYLAKVAGDMQKPDGLTIIRKEELPARLQSLRLRDLPGIGWRMEVRLNKKGIYSMEKLCSLSERELEQAWGGVGGRELWHLLRGEEISEKETQHTTLSQSHVLPPKLRTREGAYQVMKKLTVKVAERLRKEEHWASGFAIFIRYRDEPTWGQRVGLMETQDTLTFLHALEGLWKYSPPGELFAVGDYLTGLVPDCFHDPSLFVNPKLDKISKAMDAINQRFGREALHFGATHEAEALAPLRIAFTRIPEEEQ